MKSMLLIFLLTLTANAEIDIYKRQQCNFEKHMSMVKRSLIEINYNANRPCDEVSVSGDKNALPSKIKSLIKRFKTALKMLTPYFFK